MPMAILSSIWLMALVPWAAATLWLLQGRRPRVPVPYLPLWNGPVPLPRPKRKLRTIPLAVALALVATLLAILAGGRPVVRGIGSPGESPLVLIVDRGLSMSAAPGGRTRYAESVRHFVEAIPSGARGRPVELIVVPGDAPVRATLDECVARVASLQPTARDTRRALDDVIAGLLAGARGSVWVVSDQPLRRDERVIQIAPESAVRDVSIVSLAARERPRPQLMVRVRSHSPIGAGTLIVSANEKTVRQHIEFPPDGEDRDYFIDLPQLGAVLSARLDVEDDIKADDQAWLVREGSSPRIELRTPIGPELQRVIEAYQRSRPPAGASSALPVVGSVAELAGDAPGVIVERAAQATASGAVEISLHPVTTNVSSESLSGTVRAAGDSPAGWTPLVRIGGRCVVAARTDGPRQVWVGFDTPDWPATADFVVFWTNVFDWAGGGGRAAFAAHPLDEWTPQWKPTESAPSAAGLWPGLYRRSDGALRAFNAPDLVAAAAPPPQTDWRERLPAMVDGAARLDLTPVLLTVAAAAMALAAATWKGAIRPSPLAQVPEPAGAR